MESTDPIQDGMQEGDFEYVIVENPLRAVLIGYSGPGGNIVIPATLGNATTTIIGNGAFEARMNINSVTIPDGVTSIEDSAFKNCMNMVSVETGKNLVLIGRGVFSGCSKLVSIDLPDTVTTIGSSAFFNCTSLKSAGIGNGVTRIGGWAFSRCESLTTINIPDGVTSIGTSTFNSCTSIVSVTGGHKLTSISANAFFNCASLKAFRLPKGILSLGARAFDGCKSMALLKIPRDAKADVAQHLEEFRFLSSVEVEDGNECLTSIDGMLFDRSTTKLIRCPRMKSGHIKIPDSVKSIEVHAFSECASIVSVFVPNSVETIGYGAFSGCTRLGGIKFKGSINSIGESAFSGCISIRELQIPDGVASIEAWTFSRCSSLSSVEIPQSVEVIGDHAFSDCTSLSSIEIPNSVSSIGGCAFSGCTSLTSANLPEGLPRIEVQMFRSCKSLKYLKIPETVTCICSYSFYDCQALEDITIDQGITSIGDYAFAKCGSLADLKLENGLTSIGCHAFDGCISLTKINLPDSVTTIREHAFDGCTELESISVGQQIETIGGLVFRSCTSLHYVIFRGLKTPQDADARCMFEAAKNLEIHASAAADFPSPGNTWNGIKMGDYSSGDYLYVVRDGKAFISKYLGSSRELILPSMLDGYTVLGICNCSFFFVQGLESVTIPDSIASIGDTDDSPLAYWETVFDYCRELVRLTIGAGACSIGRNLLKGCAKVARIDVDPKNEEFASIDGVLYNRELTELIRYPSAKSGDFIIPNSVKTIAEYAFKDCAALNQIFLPKNIEFLESDIFRDCLSLKNIQVDSGNSNYASHEGALFNKSLTEIIQYPIGGKEYFAIPESVRIIGFYAFCGCASLKKVILPPMLLSIGSASFKSCTSLISLEIPCSVREIDDFAFGDCTSLLNVDLPDSVESIGSWAFDGCTSMLSVAVGSGVTSIGHRAFGGCTQLTSIFFKCLMAPEEVDESWLEGASTYIRGHTYGASNFPPPEEAWNGLIIGEGIPTRVDDEYEYAIEDGKARIIGYLGPGGEIVIPPMFDGYATIAIGERAFSNACGEKIRSVIAPEGIISINRDAFRGCNKLELISIPNTLRHIGVHAFWSCNKLPSIRLPSNVCSVGNCAFGGCNSLTSIDVDDENQLFVSEDGVLYSKDQTKLIQCPGGKSGTSWIPRSVDTIEDWAFAYCRKLESIEIEEGNEKFASYEGAVYNADLTRLIAYPGGRDGALNLADGITSIGDSALVGCNLTSANIPEGVKEIGWQAFLCCGLLTSVTIPSSVTRIAGHAFSGCNSLQSISFQGEALPKVGEDWIKDTNSGLRGHARPSSGFPDPGNSWNGLTMGDHLSADYQYTVSGGKATIIGYTGAGGAISIPSTLGGYPTMGIGSSAFSGCTTLTSVTIPNSVTSIGNWAFNGCTSIASISMPDSVTSLGEMVFRDCTSLTAVTIPNSVTSIGLGAFIRCASLTAVTIPSGVTTIGDGVFSGCTSLTSVTIPSSVTSIGDWAFNGCTSIASISMPDSVTYIGDNAFEYCTSLSSIAFAGRLAPKVGRNWIARTNPSLLGHATSFSDFPAPGAVWNRLTMGDNLSAEYQYTVSGDKATIIGYTGAGGAISIPPTLGGYSTMGIGSSAFSECAALASVRIPNSVISIGDWAFSYCAALTSVAIPDSVTSIGESAFEDCISLASVTIPNSVTSIGESAFSGCTTITFVGIPIGITSIAKKTFFDCRSLASVTIPNGVTSIGESAFDGCNGLTSVSIPGSVASIGDYAFEDCTSLTAVIIPSSVTSIGDWAFSGCTSLASVTIPNGVTSIGEGAFDGCNALTSVSIPGSVASIGDDAFKDCNALTSVTIPNGVTSIGDEAFSRCAALTSVTIPDSVTSIGEWAFWSCNKIPSVSIGSSVTSIGRRAFGGCDSMAAINVDPANKNYASLDGALYDKNRAILIQCPGGKTGAFTIPRTVTSIGDEAFSFCTSLTSVTIPNNVTSIGDNAFEYCTSLTSVTIPSGVTSIGDHAFDRCGSLTSITFLGPIAPTVGEGWIEKTNDSLKGHADAASNLPSTGSVWNGLTMGDYSYSSADYQYTVSNGKATITGYTGAGGAISIPQMLGGYPTVGIGSSAFSGCATLTSVTIPSSVTSIGDNAFKDCASLISVTIPKGVTSIGDSAFSDCTSLDSVTIPSSVTSIGDFAFYICTSLTSIAFEGCVAPKVGGVFWIDETNPDIVGHATSSSDFPAPGGVWNGLEMGSYLINPEKTVIPAQIKNLMESDIKNWDTSQLLTNLKDMESLNLDSATWKIIHDKVQPFLRSRDARVQDRVAVVIGFLAQSKGIGSNSSIFALNQMISNDKRHSVRKRAADTLDKLAVAGFASEDSIAALEDIMISASAEAKCAACYALESLAEEEIGSSSSIDLLNGILSTAVAEEKIANDEIRRYRSSGITDIMTLQEEIKGHQQMQLAAISAIHALCLINIGDHSSLEVLQIISSRDGPMKEKATSALECLKQIL